jgi:putative transposase
LTEADGGPLAVIVASANVHDSMILQETLEAVVIQPPNPHTELTQHLCVAGQSLFPAPLDKGYSGAPCDATAKVFGYVPHVRQIGEEKLDSRGRKRHPARRWVVERTHAWLSKCRAILVRYAKKSSNYLGQIKLACALLWFRKLNWLSRN